MNPGRCSEPSLPSDRIADIDIYNVPGAERDLHLAWRQIQMDYPYRVIWTPRNGGHWLVLRGEDVARIYADHENYSSRITIVPREWGEQYPLRPTTLDPPEHRPYRKLMTAALSRAFVRAYIPDMEEIVANAIERVQTLRCCEFINDVAATIPVQLFLRMAALPEETVAELPGYGEAPNAADVPIMDRFSSFLRPWVVARQAEPGDDLLSRLVCGKLDDRPINVDEAVDVATAMLTGGIDTVVSFLGFVMSFLAQHPRHCRALIEDPDLIRPAVIEFIRTFPIMTKARELKTDQVLDGIRLRAGDMIVLPPLQNLSEELLASPDEIDFHRPQGSGLAFGNGVHTCPGSFLASIEIEIFLREWTRRIPEFRLQASARPRMSSGILGAVRELRLCW